MAKLPKDFVIAVFIVKGNSILLVKHKKLGKWLPVGGHIEDCEDLGEAIEREVREESGLEIGLVAGKFEEANAEGARAMPVPFHVQVEAIDGEQKHEHVDFIYAARYLAGEEKLAEKEHEALKWFSLEELEKDGEISHNVRFLAKKAAGIVNAPNEEN